MASTSGRTCSGTYLSPGRGCRRRALFRVEAVAARSCRPVSISTWFDETSDSLTAGRQESTPTEPATGVGLNADRCTTPDGSADVHCNPSRRNTGKPCAIMAHIVVMSHTLGCENLIVCWI